MAKQLQVKVPDIGDFGDVPVIEVLVKAGDTVAKEDPIITLESDKATMEVPAPEAGTVVKLNVKEGDSVSKGSDVLLLELAGEDTATEPEPEAASEDESSTSETTEASAEEDQPPPETPTESAPPAANSQGGGGRQPVTVPDIGDFHDVPVVEVLVKDGDTVEAETPLITLESDKATLEVPSPAVGTVRAVKLKEGDTVNQGDVVCELETDGTGAETAEAPSADRPADKPAEKLQESTATESPGSVQPAENRTVTGDSKPPPEPPPEATRPDGVPPHASPSVRKFARELGVDLAAIAGSGPHQRILREDVQGYVKRSLASPPATTGAGSGIPPIPAVDFSQFGEIERKPLARIRKLSAAHLHRAWLNLPHVTQTDDADITELEAFRHERNAKRGIKLTLLPILLKAVAGAIDRYPEFAASLDGDELVMKQYRHIGFAADTPNGLVVPVVRDVNQKGIEALAQETAELAKCARKGKLKPQEMKGGVFSVSSLGGIGGGYFTPIINAPEVAILGVSRAVQRPVWDGEQFRPRLMLPLSLSYDHRVIDGAYAARFIVHLSDLLGDLRKLLL